MKAVMFNLSEGLSAMLCLSEGLSDINVHLMLVCNHPGDTIRYMVCLSVCLSEGLTAMVCLSEGLSQPRSVCLRVSQQWSVCLRVSLSHGLSV